MCAHQLGELKCTSDRVIKVLRADYGRRDNFICGGGTTLDCSTRGSTTTALRKRCNGKMVCKVKGDGKGLKDACPGENKYIHVVYNCERKLVVEERLETLQRGELLEIGALQLV